MSYHQTYSLCSVFIVLVLFQVGMACSWSNEGCSDDNECCSKSCHKAHEGTNPRCRHSTLGEPCVFDYHCADSLTCGHHFNCCSPYWKICVTDSDCCDEQHVCRHQTGFYYDRCLYPKNAGTRPAVFSHLAGRAVMTSLLVTLLVTWATGQLYLHLPH